MVDEFPDDRSGQTVGWIDRVEAGRRRLEIGQNAGKLAGGKRVSDQPPAYDAPSRTKVRRLIARRGDHEKI